MEEAGVSVFGGVPQFQRNWKSTWGPAHLPGRGRGILRQLSRQKQNIDWLVGRAPWRGRLRLAPWWLGAGPKAQGGLR